MKDARDRKTFIMKALFLGDVGVIALLWLTQGLTGFETGILAFISVALIASTFASLIILQRKLPEKDRNE